ncbi:transcriptional regulator, BadM/Rrf2 family [Salegentibacter echinorum]|uniref:Transcriptional regulator, BadM/Rrf2 family n=1 Tax=Salegentibacter echinorum TaxID=1073325 RepID=A0A1M5JJP3_SALEC|nr:Rrf2 family transcriptional regulator [Salegentibacter echinorum]SHG40777.1 transcriptional regulator, BadM/Rrf2 family [Salegentibacter echinorum]
MFSKACEYGIKASTYIALQSLEMNRVSLKEIASEINSPIAFTAKILHKLAKNDILESVKGPYGGFQIKKERIDSIKLAHIVAAIDGDDIYNGCALGLDECNALQPCPLHEKFVGIRSDLKKMLENTSLYEVATGLEVGLTFLKR